MEDFYVYVLLDNRKPGRFCYPNLGVSFLFEPFYVGKGKNDRVMNHFVGFDKHNPHKSRKINKIQLETGQFPDFVFYEKNMEESGAYNLEIKLIETIGRINIKSGPLTNITKGGSGGMTCSIEEMSIISKKSWKNSPVSRRDNHSKRVKLMWKDETKKKQILESRRETYKTEEYQQRISKSLTGEGNPNAKLSRKQVVGILNLLAGGWLPIHIEKLFNLRQKHIDELKRGHTWKFIRGEFPEKFESMKKFYRVKFTLNPRQIKRVIHLSTNCGLGAIEISRQLKLVYGPVYRILREGDKIPYIKKLKECKLI